MKKIIKEMDLKLDELVHIKKLETLNINLDYFLKNKDYKLLLENKKQKEIKYIKNPKFDVETYRNINSEGILKCFYPIQYEINYGTVNFDFINKHSVTEDFIGTKVLRLKLNDDLNRFYVESFKVDHLEFKNIYYGLIRYLCAEKNIIELTNMDLIYLFRKTLELYCKNHSNELEEIIKNGSNYLTISSFFNDYKLCILNKPINAFDSKHSAWQKSNTFLDNRKIENDKILTLKNQIKK